MSEALDKLYERVRRGIEWLDEHDPGSVFHAWYQAGLTPATKMPAQPDEVRERWQAYFKQRELFERLWKQMVVLERTEKAGPAFQRGRGFW